MTDDQITHILRARLTPSTRLVWLLLASEADFYGECVLTQTEIAATLGLSVQTIVACQNALAHTKNGPVIEVQKRPNQRSVIRLLSGEWLQKSMPKIVENSGSPKEKERENERENEEKKRTKRKEEREKGRERERESLGESTIKAVLCSSARPLAGDKEIENGCQAENPEIEEIGGFDVAWTLNAVAEAMDKRKLTQADSEVVRRWLRDGFEPSDMLRVIETVTSKRPTRTKGIKSLRYFHSTLVEHLASSNRSIRMASAR